MKLNLMATLVMVTFAAPAFASPEIITMKNKVKFNHRAHTAATGQCRTCHEKGIGKIEGFGKVWAHKKCTGCHADMRKGPTNCSGCHKRNS